MKIHAVKVFVGAAGHTLCGIVVANEQIVADPALATCKKCQPKARSAHQPKYVRRALGGSPIRGGGTYYGYTIHCSCGWELRVNEPKRQAVIWFNDHRRTAEKKGKS